MLDGDWWPRSLLKAKFVMAYSLQLPVVALKLLLSDAASSQGRVSKNKCVMVLGRKVAFLYGTGKRELYIELPEQDPRSKSRDWVGRLLKAMSGTRDAPQFLQGKVKSLMLSLVLVQN